MTAALRRFAWVLATWFGCGLVPRAPGTMGALGAVPLYLLASQGGRLGVAMAAAVVTAIGVWSASVVARELRSKDPQIVVIDEVAGMMVTMLAAGAASWPAVILGFLLFRLFDIIKPWPIRRVERLPGGWGIVMDDVVAGFMSAALLAAIRVSGAMR